ncbi:class II aldolase/adducin family protein [Sphingobium mellinum]|uniref:class II aldolase/adducin family protein n=1 Tax=Sphingobium mellinum TaxID=1387166 RepID=UPI0030EE3AD7
MAHSARKAIEQPGAEYVAISGRARERTVDLPSMKHRVSDAEWQIRVDLAAAYRLIAHFGWDDVIFTHLSARVPGQENHFLLNPFDLMFEEVTASSLVKVDVDGVPTDPTPFTISPAAFAVHSAVHMSRHDAQAVLHLHTPYGQAVSAQSHGLLPLTQSAMAICSDLGYHDYEGGVQLNERERIVADLGGKSTMLLRNHGTLAVGETVGQAFLKMYFLERACEAQVHALSAGTDNLHQASHSVIDAMAKEAPVVLKAMADSLAWPALLRKAYRLDARFAE